MQPQLIDTKTAKALVEADALKQAELVPGDDGWRLQMPVGRGFRTLSKARSREPRTWADAQRALHYARFELKLTDVTVRLSSWDPQAMKPSRSRLRPDRAQALRQVHAAAEHDRWFRAQVEAAIAEADAAPEAGISSERVKADWAKKRAELLARASK